MYINRKSSLYASPRNEMHVGNETGESGCLTVVTGLVILALVVTIVYFIAQMM